MVAGFPSQRTLALVVLVSLVLLTLCSSSSEPPEVAITDLRKTGGGVVIAVVGVVVDSWSSDSSSVSIVLADLKGLSTVKVVCAPGVLGTSIRAHIGDEARAVGELEVTGGRPILWSTEDDVSVLRTSSEVLTVGSLAEAWSLLIDDRIELRGVLVSSSSEERSWLMDPDGGERIEMLLAQVDVGRFAGRMVLVDAVLRLDSRAMALVLEVRSISASP